MYARSLAGGNVENIEAKRDLSLIRYGKFNADSVTRVLQVALHALLEDMRPISIDVACSVVCACLSVCWTAETDKPIEMPLIGRGGADSRVPKE